MGFYSEFQYCIICLSRKISRRRTAAMKLEEKNLIVRRAYKEVYRCDDVIVKIFSVTHPKSDVFNEALITARIEETGLEIPKVKEVTQIDG